MVATAAADWLSQTPRAASITLLRGAAAPGGHGMTPRGLALRIQPGVPRCAPSSHTHPGPGRGGRSDCFLIWFSRSGFSSEPPWGRVARLRALPCGRARSAFWGRTLAPARSGPGPTRFAPESLEVVGVSPSGTVVGVSPTEKSGFRCWFPPPKTGVFPHWFLAGVLRAARAMAASSIVCKRLHSSVGRARPTGWYVSLNVLGDLCSRFPARPCSTSRNPSASHRGWPARSHAGRCRTRRTVRR